MLTPEQLAKPLLHKPAVLLQPFWYSRLHKRRTNAAHNCGNTDVKGWIWSSILNLFTSSWWFLLRLKRPSSPLGGTMSLGTMTGWVGVREEWESRNWCNMAQTITATMQIKAEQWKKETTQEGTDRAKEKETGKHRGLSETLLQLRLHSLQIRGDKRVWGEKGGEKKAGRDRKYRNRRLT